MSSCWHLLSSAKRVMRVFTVNTGAEALCSRCAYCISWNKACLLLDMLLHQGKLTASGFLFLAPFVYRPHLQNYHCCCLYSVCIQTTLAELSLLQTTLAELHVLLFVFSIHRLS